MADREVTQSMKSEKGDIIALCNSRAIWSPKLKSMAILEIEESIHRYFVKIDDVEVDIHVVKDRLKGKYLRTDPDKTKKNNLDDLPVL
jgi:hypothetical protein